MSGTGNSNRLKAVKPNQGLLIVFPVNKIIYFGIIHYFGLCILHAAFLDIAFSGTVMDLINGNKLDEKAKKMMEERSKRIRSKENDCFKISKEENHTTKKTGDIIIKNRLFCANSM